jgi:hypothetical protein
MNFDDIKKEMNASVEELPKRKFNIDLNKGKNNPVQLIRSNMIKEILFVVFGIVLFLIYPFILSEMGMEMPALEKSTYMIFMSLNALMMSLYIMKLIVFVKKSSNFSTNTRDSIKEYVYEVRLTLESYKAYVVASSLLIPIPIFALLSFRNGWDKSSDYNFERWFTLQISTNELLVVIVSYLIFSVLFYWITMAWAKHLYGKHVAELETIVNDLEDTE